MAKTNGKMIANNKKAYHDYFILDNIEASINTIKTTESNKYFNLQGHEMGTDSRKLPKGIYINNGKKIVIK